MTPSPVLAIFTPSPPYNFARLLAFIQRHPAPTLDIVQGAAYRRVFTQGDALALIEVTAAPTSSANAPVLQVRCLAQTGNINEALLIKQVAHVLAIESPQRAAIWEIVQMHDALRGLLADVTDLPLLRAATLFDALMNVIIEQQIAWRAAVKAQRWLLEWGARSIFYEGRAYYAYPTPQQIASATQDDLKPLKITFKRIDLMRQLAAEIAAGTFNPAAAQATSPHATYTELLRIKGIGHWTAAVVAQRVHGTSPFIADNDVALQAAVGRYFYARKGRISREEVAALFSPYGEYGGDVAFYTLVRWVFDEYPVVED